MLFSACWKKLPFINLEWVSYFYLYLSKAIVSGLLCLSAGSAGCWGLPLAAFFLGQSELHHSFLSLEVWGGFFADGFDLETF